MSTTTANPKGSSTATGLSDAVSTGRQVAAELVNRGFDWGVVTLGREVFTAL